MKKSCGICGGTGQISYFQGVSRFLLTVDECPECAGTGVQLEPDKTTTRRKKRRKVAEGKKGKESQRNKN